jgi:hypothetical protein
MFNLLVSQLHELLLQVQSGEQVHMPGGFSVTAEFNGKVSVGFKKKKD